jgi:hypothetical protein
MNLITKSQVQVSRMIPHLSVWDVNFGRNAVPSAPHVNAHSSFLLMRNSKHRSLYTFNTHLVDYGADLSLLPPRHRCYALLSSGLSRLVRESQRNSYEPNQDGLW